MARILVEVQNVCEGSGTKDGNLSVTDGGVNNTLSRTNISLASAFGHIL